MKQIKVRQRDLTDCGAACLASVCAYYDLYLPVARIRQWAGTGLQGTSVFGLVEAARKAGFEAEGVRCTFEGLHDVPLPAIAHVTRKNGAPHFVVLLSRNDQMIHLMDPAGGTVTDMPASEFKKIWQGVLILLAPGANFRKGKHPNHLSRILNMLGSREWSLLFTLFLALIYALIGLCVPVYIQHYFDNLITGSGGPVFTAILLTLLAVQLFVGIVRSVVSIHLSQYIDNRLILGYCRKLFQLPLSFFLSMKTGEILSRIHDAVKIRTAVNDAFLAVFISGLMIFSSAVLMLLFHPVLALLAMSVVPIYTAVYWILARVNRTWERNAMERSAAFESLLVESVQNMTTIRSLNFGEGQLRKLETAFFNLQTVVRRTGITSIIGISFADFISRTTGLLLVWYGGTFVGAGQLTVGELFSIYILYSYFTAPVLGVLTSNRTFQSAAVASDRLFEIVDLDSETSPPQSSIALQGDIVYDEVQFVYQGRQIIFDSLSLRISEGSLTAITGESGCGKTTLLNLLIRSMDIQSGSIRIGETNLTAISNRELRNHIAVVHQQTDLFEGTILSNIAPGVDHPDLKLVNSICEQLGLSDFIESLPLGLQTYVTERAGVLSGGQRQKIAIARALFRQSPVLVLDEATSSLDGAAEAMVHNTLVALKARGTTIILISHRLSALVMADEIIYLENGAVAERGTHTDLMGKDGKYRTLWERQLPASLLPGNAAQCRNNAIDIAHGIVNVR